jgi:hypothetical protein
MEALTCYCSKDLCNNKNFKKKEFQKFRKVAKKELNTKVTSFWLKLLDASLNGFTGFVYVIFGIIIVNAILSWRRKRRLEMEVVDPEMEFEEIEENPVEEEILNDEEEKKEL